MTTNKTTTPKRGKKGGASFPRIPLQPAVAYARKLVSKTHVSALPRETIFPGVFGAKGVQGEVRAAALRQYGLLQGKNAAIEATQLAKDIAAAPSDESQRFCRIAALKPKIFKALYDVFQGDTVSLAKLRQQAAHFKVHIDSASDCASHFAESLVFAGLATQNGDTFAIAGVDSLPTSSERSADEQLETDDQADSREEEVESALPTDAPEDSRPAKPSTLNPPASQPRAPQGTSRAVIQVNVTLDSSLDTDKLEKQLELLRRYGAL